MALHCVWFRKGIHDEVEEQSTVSETALSDDSPSLSYSSRETCTQKNLVEETDIRMKDFQEWQKMQGQYMA